METLIAVCAVGFGVVFAAIVYQARKIGALVDELRADRAAREQEAESRIAAARGKIDAVRGARAFVPR